MKLPSFLNKYVLISGVAVVSIIVGVTYYRSSARIVSAQDLFENGNRFFSSASYDPATAEAWYQKALRADPKLSLAHYQLARLYFLENRSDEALAEIDAELTAHPENIRSHYIRGLIDLYRKNYTGAVQDFDAFLAGKPQSWAALNDLSVAYLHAGNYGKAEEVSRRGLSYFPDNAWLQSNLGIALLNEKKIEEARSLLVAARESFANMSVEDWARAYPGNEDAVVSKGLVQTRSAVEANIRSLDNHGVDERLPDFRFISRIDGGAGYAIAACDESIGMSVAPLAIQRGQSATLSWLTTNVEGCSIDNGVGAVDPTGSVVVTPTASTNYTLSCSSYATPHTHGTTWTSSAALTVQWLDLKGNTQDGPISLYMPNTAMVLDWTSGGGPYAGCSAFGDWAGSSYAGVGTQSLGNLARGSANPGGGKSYNFGLNCGPSDSVAAVVYQLPIETITPDKTSVTPPDVVTLTWNSRYADSCTITDNQGSAPINARMNNDASYRSSGTVRVHAVNAGDYTFTLSCDGLDGRTTVVTAPVTNLIKPRIHEVNP